MQSLQRNGTEHSVLDVSDVLFVSDVSDFSDVQFCSLYIHFLVFSISTGTALDPFNDLQGGQRTFT